MLLFPVMCSVILLVCFEMTVVSDSETKSLRIGDAYDCMRSKRVRPGVINAEMVRDNVFAGYFLLRKAG
ncbi:MAG: hypothetical protein CSA26_07150 [Desulfobacterales bacterium]|nr:MAG: hypothetical protein CSA26_07150 [Desulfobacterales bacterium]